MVFYSLAALVSLFSETQSSLKGFWRGNAPEIRPGHLHQDKTGLQEVASPPTLGLCELVCWSLLKVDHFFRKPLLAGGLKEWHTQWDAKTFLEWMNGFSMVFVLPLLSM